MLVLPAHSARRARPGQPIAARAPCSQRWGRGRASSARRAGTSTERARRSASTTLRARTARRVRPATAVLGGLVQQHASLAAAPCRVSLARRARRLARAQAVQPGTVQPVGGQGECIDCVAGKFMNESGKLECHDCVAGSSRRVRPRHCCSEGSFSNTPGLGSMASAPVCRLVVLDGLARAQTVLPTAQPAGGRGECIDCVASKFMNESGKLGRRLSGECASGISSFAVYWRQLERE